MLERIISWSLRHRWAVLVLLAVAVVLGALSLRALDIDAFPDTTPVQVQVNTVAPALAPEQIEQQITFPIEQSISGLPGLQGVRSVSKFGLSQVVVTFADGTDVYFARRLVDERLGAVALPPGIPRPELGPVATGLGEVFHYVLTSDRGDVTELRTAQDWLLKPALRAVPGVAEVNGWGGNEKQYQVRVDPVRLLRHGLTVDQLVTALAANNVGAGGGSIGAQGSMLLIQGIGGVTDLDQVRQIALLARDGVAVRVGDVAEVAFGAEIRRGAVTYQGRGEAVLGLGFMLMGENTHAVTTRLRQKLDELRPRLPAGVRAEVVYARTELVDQVIDTVRNNLFEGGLLVIAVLFVFLGNLRAGLIVAAAIPLSMLFAFGGMWRFAIAGSLMSLGAIDFGLIVDSAVIQVENAVRHLARDDDGGGARRRVDVVRDAVLEVRKPTMFGELIIALVYVPILLLEGVEGKLFRPMALTVTFALAGSLLLSLTVVPVLASLLLPRRRGLREPLDPWPVRAAGFLYAPALRAAMRHRYAAIGGAVALLAAGAIVARGLGAEFVPRLSEGAIVVNVIRIAGTDLDESVRYNTRMEQAVLRAFPDEVRHAWSRCGAAEIATDPMGVELTDLFLTLQPRERWRRASSQAELVALLQRELRDMPGQRLAFLQPIEMRMNEMIAGVRGDVAVKIYGDDLEVLKQKADEVGGVLGAVAGAADLSTEQVTGQPVLQIRIDRDALARHGVPASAVMDLVEAVGGRRVGEVIEGQSRFPPVVRLPDRLRANAAAIGAVLVTTPAGQRLPLSSLAAIEEVEGPSTITREWGQRRIAVQVNVRGRDVGSYVDEARRRVAAEVALPAGRYRFEWGGQFENYERARRRLAIVVPIVLVSILGLLYATYRSVRDALRVFTGVPFAAVGGVAALWLRDMPFSISAGVGFIALSGVAVLGDMVLVSYVRQLMAGGLDRRAAVEAACMTRLRPVLMTALVAALGLVPMALSTGVGAEVQRPLATVVIGGVLSSTLLTLLVLPAIYLVVGAGKYRPVVDGSRPEQGSAMEPALAPSTKA